MPPATAAGCARALQVSELDLQLLLDKFRHEDMPEMVNYIAFANTVAPPDWDEMQGSAGTIAAVCH
jgi:hypothetical protein